MSDDVKHECAVALAVLRKPAPAAGDFGGTKLSLLLEKQHNRGQDGAGAAILGADPSPGAPPYTLFKSASSTPLADLLGMIAKRSVQARERIFLGHLRYATFGKNDVAFCHPFVHESDELRHTLLLAGNFNLTNAAELFDDYSRHGAFPTSKADGYLVTQLIARELERGADLRSALSRALCRADGAWTLCGMTGDGWAFATRDPNGIRPAFMLVTEEAAVVASERPAIQAAFDASPEEVEEIPPGSALIISPGGEVAIAKLWPERESDRRSCSFERIYFSRANDAAIHRERKALGAALAKPILEAVGGDFGNTFFSYIPNSARIAFHGLLEALWTEGLAEGKPVRFGEIAVKDAKFRTFIADAAARREFYRHVYDVTYGLIRRDRDTLVVLDDSIVRGNTMKRAILPMLDRLGPKRIVIASSAPPIRYPDCYGIDMSSLGELVAFRALVNLMGENADEELRNAPLSELYARFDEKEHADEIARLLTPPDLKADVKVVFQSVGSLHEACPGDRGDWYFTGNYPTEGGRKVLATALTNYLERKNGRSY
ncbi:MAG: amidophosphoribosyltransferase [Kiritimatiellae bacterium]|nr:amidophosphoribosyltransferase [Kiritimatiellia bacterium]